MSLIHLEPSSSDRELAHPIIPVVSDLWSLYCCIATMDPSTAPTQAFEGVCLSHRKMTIENQSNMSFSAHSLPGTYPIYLMWILWR